MIYYAVYTATVQELTLSKVESSKADHIECHNDSQLYLFLETY